MDGKVKFALVKVVSQRLLLCLCGLATAAAAPLHGRPAKTSSCEAAVQSQGRPSRNQSPVVCGLLVAAGELELPHVTP
ncbi:hypothetical protein PVAP13_4NG231481 [Panicum virgatum]|uniref:Secreted protein n=1 Tax=Panicum virgatum TaxID=38727 RepID=A0A8T0T688_PANVG|nr:hypothetical protein PVAP13_4NG231481 [Panicum virgatum]